MNQENKQPAQDGQSDQSGQGRQGQQVQIKANEKDLKGRYSNLATINHTKEEFVVDFLNVIPPTGTLNARVIMSPGHTKRLAKTLAENIKKYEEQFGKVDEIKGEDENKIGFV